MIHEYIEGILPKGPYPPCLRMADRALLAGYPLYDALWYHWTTMSWYDPAYSKWHRPSKMRNQHWHHVIPLIQSWPMFIAWHCQSPEHHFVMGFMKKKYSGSNDLTMINCFTFWQSCLVNFLLVPPSSHFPISKRSIGPESNKKTQKTCTMQSHYDRFYLQNTRNILQTTLSYTFSSVKNYCILILISLSLFLMVHLTIR